MRSDQTKVNRIILVSLIVLVLFTSILLVGISTNTAKPSDLTSPASPAIDMFLKIEGIDGEVDQPGREGYIDILKFHHAVTIPRDPETRTVTGTRVYTPIVVTKFIDKSSPLLMLHLVDSMVIPQVDILFYEVLLDGDYQPYYNISLQSVTIVSIRPYITEHDPVLGTSENLPVEEVSFTYGKIIWTHEVSGISTEDDLTSPIS